MRTFVTFLCIFLLCNIKNLAQVAKTQVVRVMAKANDNGTITLIWPKETYAGRFDIYRRDAYSVKDWGAQPYGTVTGIENTFTDGQAKQGDAFEYMVVKANGSTTDALGYIFAGNQYAETRSFGSIILVTDSNYILPLAPETGIFKENLTAEGWNLIEIFAGRSESAQTVRQRIINACNATNIKATTIVLLGHIPVPYSGYFSSTGAAPPPDGHVEGSGNHTGAWPADVYYGIVENVFTDNLVTITTGTQTRHHNLPGDGKFDQTKLPLPATLEVGRIDFFDMPVFGFSDTVLTRKYLQRNNAWRTGAWKVTERALIDNNFATLNLASTGYANFAALIGLDSVFDNRDYFTAQKNGSYLWSYGCGAGSYTSCSGIGNTNNFVNDSFENVFTILAGSYFGDFDVRNNFMRAAIAAKSLVCFWGGIPKWYVQHMGMGERIGKGTLLTQNNTGLYFTGNFNLSANSMHIALLGDPTLKQRNLKPVTNLTAVSTDKKVYLNWHGNGNSAFAIYRIDTALNTYTRLNKTPVTDTFYVDAENYYTGNYKYVVKGIALETTASGSYYNTGGGAFALVNHVNSTARVADNAFGINVYPNPAVNRVSVNLTNFNSSNCMVKIYSALGEILYLKNIEVNNNTIELMPELPAGYYILAVDAGNKQAVEKIVIVR